MPWETPLAPLAGSLAAPRATPRAAARACVRRGEEGGRGGGGGRSCSSCAGARLWDDTSERGLEAVGARVEGRIPARPASRAVRREAELGLEAGVVVADVEQGKGDDDDCTRGGGATLNRLALKRQAWGDASMSRSEGSRGHRQAHSRGLGGADGPQRGRSDRRWWRRAWRRGCRRSKDGASCTPLSSASRGESEDGSSSWRRAERWALAAQHHDGASHRPLGAAQGEAGRHD